MALICPTVLAETPESFAEQIGKVAFAPRIQIDVSDGEFAPNKTINLNQLYFNDGQATDLHLMIKRPAQWLEAAIALGPNLIVLHAEAEIDFLKLSEHIRRFGIKVGVAILPDTTVESVAEPIRASDHVLIFGGHLGFMGGAADLAQLKKVAEIRAINHDVEIGWDGGAKLDNIKQIAAAGVDVINAGSAITKSDNPEAAYTALTELL
ncbi:MAG: hypothetical protein LBK50_00275 [Candidatus Nomurabacteria bacterium]|jgi:ribulose-phosphate 3-epimerase|nr:hypothetical protein [Candidatus Nomurabacteria bacterium]